MSALRIEALEGLLAQARREAEAGRVAIAQLATLDSERAANAALTEEIEVLRSALKDIDFDCRTFYNNSVLREIAANALYGRSRSTEKDRT